MIPTAHLLTAPTSLAHYKPDDLSSTALSLLQSTRLFLQIDRDLVQPEEQMAQSHLRPQSRGGNSELWFSMPSRARLDGEQTIRGPEQSAYQATSSRHTTQRSASPSRFPLIPLISTTSVNKPLPPSPESDKKRRKPPSLRSLIRRRPSDHGDSSHLHPEPYQPHHSASTNGSLSPEPYNYRHQSSRSMPSSPAGFLQVSNQAAPLIRSQSAAANYADALYSPVSPVVSPGPQQRSVSMNSHFEPQLPRARRTFPESSASSNTMPNEQDRQRPNTWMSPTEPFQNPSEFHLFVEATSGLPDGVGFDGPSPTSPPHLQGSLFSRGRQNDRIPIPLQNPSALEPRRPHPVEGWQSMGYDYLPPQPSHPQLTSSSALPRRESYQPPQASPRLNAVNLELERLGISDDEDLPEDELPNYAQSQAEMSAKKRQEATSRARELEERWNNSRGWRSR